MEHTRRTDTVFVVKENEEHCFLFSPTDSLEFVDAVLRASERSEGGISRHEAVEILEGVLPERLRSI